MDCYLTEGGVNFSFVIWGKNVSWCCRVLFNRSNKSFRPLWDIKMFVPSPRATKYQLWRRRAQDWTWERSLPNYCLLFLICLGTKISANGGLHLLFGTSKSSIWTRQPAEKNECKTGNGKNNNNNKTRIHARKLLFICLTCNLAYQSNCNMLINSWSQHDNMAIGIINIKLKR